LARARVGRAIIARSAQTAAQATQTTEAAAQTATLHLLKQKPGAGI